MNYKRRRTGTTLVEDTKNIESNCNQITFANNGDIDVTITIVDQKVSYLLGRYQTISFGGEERPDIKETNMFNVAFGVPGVGDVVSCSLERMDILPEC